MKKCKNCGSEIEDFNIDYDEGCIRCFFCNHILPNEMFFNDTTVNRFAKKIPELRRDEFMKKLGFEKRPVKTGAIIGGLLASLLPIFLSLDNILKKQKDFSDLIFAAIPFLIVLFMSIRILWEGIGPKYVRIS